jgi:hypothetical protein
MFGDSDFASDQSEFEDKGAEILYDTKHVTLACATEA